MARWCGGKSVVPLLEHCTELRLELRQGRQFGVNTGQPLAHDCTDFPAGRAAAIAFCKYAGEILDREAGRQGAADQRAARRGICGISPIPGARPRRLRQHAAAFVVAQRVGADTGRVRKLARAQCHRCSVTWLEQ